MATGAAAAVGIGITMYAQHKEARAQQAAARAMADAKGRQAMEILRRSEQNLVNIERDARKFQASQVAAFAAGGVDISSGVTLLTLEETEGMLAENISTERREAEFRAAQLYSGAALDIETGNEIRRAARIRQAGTAVQGAGTLATIAERPSASSGRK